MELKRNHKLIIGLWAVIFILLVRLFIIQIIDDSYKRDADNNSMVYHTIYPPRGIVYDRNGEVLVGNRICYDILVTPREVAAFDTLALASALELDTLWIREQMAYYKKYRSRIGWQTLQFAKRVSIEQYKKFAERAYDFPGFRGQVRTVREYPFNAGGNLLGYVSEVNERDMERNPGVYKSGDYIGKTGLEAAREKDLKGEKGYHVFLRFGQLFMTLAPPFAAIAGWIILGETLSWKAGLAMLVTLSGIAISILSRDGGHHFTVSLPLKGILLGLGAGLGQGVGLVLSKVGVQYYADAVPADAPAAMDTMLPFASTMIRALVGGVGFLLLMSLQHGLPRLKSSLQDRKGMLFVLILTLFGPVLGVSLSLMAVRYTDAGIASTLMALSPVLILIPYAFIYKQRIRFKEVLGVAVSMAGVCLFFLL